MELSFEDTSNNTKFIIPIDILDIGLLQKCYKQRNFTVPIWSNCSRDDSYLEFEVLAEEIESDAESDSECEENYNKQQCHICNIDVPNIYIRQHNESAKHKTCLAIADHALERVRKQMSQLSNDLLSKKTSTYFCEPCDVAVKLKNYEKHEKCDEHKENVTRGKLLNELSMIYINNMVSKDLSTVFEEKYVEIDGSVAKIKDSDSKSNSGAKDLSTIQENGREIIKIETFNESKAKPQIKQMHSIDSADTSCDDDSASLEHLKIYFEDISHHNTSQMEIVVVNVTTLKIKTVSGVNVHVTVDNFHGFFQAGCNLQCRVCRCLIDDKELHKDNVEHIRRIMVPVKNKHCIRTLNDIWKHCILCNDILENTDMHILCTNAHKLRLREALVMPINSKSDDETKENTPDTLPEDTEYCNICHVEISDKKSKKIHMGSRSHILNRWYAKQDSNSQHYLMKKTDDQYDVTCVVCKDIVRNDVDIINTHIASEDHESAFRNFLMVHNVKKTHQSIGKWVCQVCTSGVMSGKELVNHVGGKKHLKMLEEFTDIQQTSTPVETITEMEYDENIDTNVCSVTDNLSKKIQEPGYVADDEDTQDDLYHFCDMYLAGNAVSIRLHEESVSHTEKVALPGNITKAQDICDESDKNTGNKILYLFEKTIVPDILQCKVCKKCVSYFEISIHVNNVSHETKYLEMLDKNNLKPTADGCYCTKCNTFVEDRTELNHIVTDHHKLNTARCSQSAFEENISKSDAIKTTGTKTNVDEQGTHYCGICKTSVSNAKDKIKLHYEGSTHKFLLNEQFIDEDDDTLDTHYQMKKVDNTLVCKVCDVKVLKNTANIYAHINSKKHLNKYKSLLALNGLKTIDGAIYCDLCRVRVIDETEFLHIITKKHINNLDTNSKLFKPVNEPVKKKQSIKAHSNTVCADTSETSSEQSLSIVKTKLTAKNNIVQDVSKNSNNHSVLNGTQKTVKSESNTVVPTYIQYLEKGQVLCTICDIKIANHPNNINEHIKGATHQVKITEIDSNSNKDNVNETIFKELNFFVPPFIRYLPNREVLCQICDVPLKNNHKQIYHHIKGAKHTANTTNKSAKVSNEQTNNKDKIALSEPNSGFPSYIQYVSNGEVLCKICNLQITNGSKNIIGHLKGNTHTAHTKTIITLNCITTSAIGYYCLICKMYTEKDYFEHINLPEHSRKLLINKACSSQTVSNTNNNPYFCDVCSVHVPNNPSNIRAHVLGMKHKSKLDSL